MSRPSDGPCFAGSEIDRRIVPVTLQYWGFRSANRISRSQPLSGLAARQGKGAKIRVVSQADALGVLDVSRQKGVDCERVPHPVGAPVIRGRKNI
jgi:hypothetical protein